MSAPTKHLLILSAIVLIGANVMGGCSDKGDTGASVSPQEKILDTFTFFGIGPTSELSGGLRDELEELLGRGGVETQTTIDLTLDGVEGFAESFPRLQALHDALNYLPRQRVEHDTVQLTYHYARKKSVPFDRVRLVFWKEREAPLFFSLYAKRDGGDFIESIREKHGEPQVMEATDAASRTLYWEKPNARLIISVTKNRIGFNEYNFGIYYLDNLTALAEAEQKAREAAEKEKEKTGEFAF